VDDAFFVGGIERVGDLNADAEQLVERKRTPADAVLEGLAFEYSITRKTFLRCSSMSWNRADVGMVQGGGGASFAAEALKGLRISC